MPPFQYFLEDNNILNVAVVALNYAIDHAPTYAGGAWKICSQRTRARATRKKTKKRSLSITTVIVSSPNAAYMWQGLAQELPIICFSSPRDKSRIPQSKPVSATNVARLKDYCYCFVPFYALRKQLIFKQHADRAWRKNRQLYVAPFSLLPKK
jgi:hypothetical protein